MKILCALAIPGLAACVSTVTNRPGQVSGEVAASNDSVVEATSLLGAPLLRPAPVGETRAGMEKRLAAAGRAYARTPLDADSIIWLGRRTAYLGRFNEAIAVYTRGIATHPEDPRMYRHRGHRYITIRKLDSAISDFQRAAALSFGKPDQVEPDGLPNARNIPASTLKSNIRYHLGLAHYLRGDFDMAARLYAEDVAESANADMLVASSHWLYMSLRRLGRSREAAAVLQRIAKEMPVIENGTYHRLLLMYKRELEPADLLAAGEGSTSLDNVTAAYGVGNWHLYSGRPAEAERIFREIVTRRAQWASFGYLAAEAELARTR